MIGIYIIKNNFNNKVYVGCSMKLDEILKATKTILDRNKHYNIGLQTDYNNYKSDFEFTILEVIEFKTNRLTKTEEWELRDIRDKYIIKYKSNNPKYGYNIALASKYYFELATVGNTQTQTLFEQFSTIYQQSEKYIELKIKFDKLQEKCNQLEIEKKENISKCIECTSKRTNKINTLSHDKKICVDMLINDIQVEQGKSYKKLEEFKSRIKAIDNIIFKQIELIQNDHT